MLRISNLEEIQNVLLLVPKLVNLQERRDPTFIEEVKNWLTTLEKVLESNRMPVAGNVATLRGVVISAEGGVIAAGVEFHGRTTKKKVKEAAAADMLRQAADLVSNVIRKDNERVAEAERMCRQLVAVAKAKGLRWELPSGGSYVETLKAVWRTLSSDPDVSPGTVNVEGLIGPQDALIVLDRTATSDTPKE